MAAPASLLVGAAVLYLYRLGRVPLYDLDESVYAEISREMALLGHWITPHLDFIPYLEKPPLLYWLNAAAFRLLGLSAFSARIGTALAAVAGIGFTYRLGRDLWSRRAGLIAGAVLATSFGYFIFGRMAMPDMLFLALVAGAHAGFARALFGAEDGRGAAAYGGYAAMAGAVLAKGLIGFFPAVTVGAYLLTTREWRLLPRLRVLPGGALFLLIAAPWHILVAIRNPGFLSYYVLNEHVMRFLGKRNLINYATLPVPTYLAMTFAWFCPWTIFLPAALWRCWPRSRERPDRAMLFVLLWAGLVIGFFVLSAARLEYYALPALPALALLVGRQWDFELGNPARRPSRLLSATWVALIAFALCLAPAAGLFPRLAHLRFYNLFPAPTPLAKALPPGTAGAIQVDLEPGFGALVPLLEAVVGLVVLGTCLSAFAWYRRRPALALAGLVAAMAVGLTVVERGFLLFAPYRSVSELAAVVRHDFQPADQVLLQGKYELHASLGFYTRLPIRVYRGRDGILLNGTRYAHPAGTFVSDAEFARLWRGAGQVFLVSDAPGCLAHALALSPATQVLGREGESWLLANHPEPKS